MILTVCNNAQYGHALLLRESVLKHHPDQLFLEGMAGGSSHAPLIPSTEISVRELGLSQDQLADLSARYTPTEFRAALKPHLIRAAFAKYPDEDLLLCIDPTAYVYQPLTPIFDVLKQHTILLNPHWLQAPKEGQQPDEKHLQNVGLYSSGFIGFRRHPETIRMLNWWADRCFDRAHINFCEGQCLDQLWLMHVPALFDGVGILKNPGVQVALWNLPQRRLNHTPDGWQVSTETSSAPLITADFLGLVNPNEGLFQQQTRLQKRYRPDVQQLISEYEAARVPVQFPTAYLSYGQQPEPVIRRGWRRSAKLVLQQLSRWIDNVPVPPIHR